MKNIFLICVALISTSITFGQSTVPRSGGFNTPIDSNLFIGKSFRPPVFLDTTQANTFRTLDSCGKLIYTRTPQVYWRRDCSPSKHWTQLLDSASVSSMFVDSVFVTNAPKMDSLWQLKNGNLSLVNIFDKQCGIIEPGLVVHDSLLYYTVSPSIYILCSDGIRRTSITTQVQLQAADATYDRIDAIILDSSGYTTLTGEPSTAPRTPQINPDQLLLTYILVPAGVTSAPSCTTSDITIYDENTEWAGSTNMGASDFDLTINPYYGVKDAFFTGTLNGYYIEFTGSPTNISLFTTLELHLNVGAAWSYKNGPSLDFEWFNGATSVSNVVEISKGRGYDNKLSDQWQTIVIPISSWAFSATSANRLRITYTKSPIPVNMPFYLDYIKLGGACIQQPPSTTGSYINNQTTLQKNANFNIDGGGTIGGFLKLPSYDSATRNDGTLTKALGTDGFGNVILGTISATGTSNSATQYQNRGNLDTVMASVNDSLIGFKSIRVAAGTNVTVTPTITDSTINYEISSTGTSNSATQYQWAYYANSGTTVSGITVSPNKIVATDANGLPMSAGVSVTQLQDIVFTNQYFTNSGTGVSILNQVNDSTIGFSTFKSSDFDLGSDSVISIGASLKAYWNGKQAALTLTTTGTGGAATFDGTTLNIPQYSGGGGSFSDAGYANFDVTKKVLIKDTVSGFYYHTAGAAMLTTSPADNDMLIDSSNYWVNRTPAQVKSILSLNNVENIPLSTWAGTTNITTLGTIGTGIWQGSVIGSAYLPSTIVYNTGSYANPAWITSLAFSKISGITGSPDGTKFLRDDGSWQIVAGGGGSISLAAIGSTPNANGATISGSTLNLEPASASFGGVVTTGSQTFAGDKTFNGSIKLTNPSSTNSNGFIYSGSDILLSTFNYGNNGTVTTSGYNIFLGILSGNLTMGSTATTIGHSSYNTGIGYKTLNGNTTGQNNVAIGFSALPSNTSGGYNSAIGTNALYSNTSGTYNAAFGLNSLYGNVSGSNNTAFGTYSGSGGTTGIQNSIFGNQALYSNTGGSNNVAFGFIAGRYLANGSSENTVVNNSVYLGPYTKSGALSSDNEIVIGYSAIGNGSNSATIGNTSINKTILNGRVGIGGITSPTALLHLAAGTATANTAPLKLTRTSAVLNTTPEDGAIEVDTNHIYHTIGSTRYQLDQQLIGTTLSTYSTGGYDVLVRNQVTGNVEKTTIAGGGSVASVFGRTGAVVAASGDYTASQVTNAVDQTGSYSDPSWITSLAGTKVLPSYTGNDGKVLGLVSGALSWVTSGIGGVTLGTDNQIPFTNAGGTDFEYSSNLIYDGITLSASKINASNTAGGYYIGGVQRMYDLDGFFTRILPNTGYLQLYNGTDNVDVQIFDATGTNALSLSQNPSQAEIKSTTAGTLVIQGGAGATQIGGTLKVGSISQDDTEAKVVVWNSTDKVLEWRDATTISGDVSGATNITPTFNTSIFGGFFSNKTVNNLNFRSLSSPVDGGVSITQLTDEVEVKDNAFDVKGRVQYYSSEDTISIKTFFLPTNCAGIVTMYVSSMQDGGGAYTVEKKISFQKYAGTLTLGTSVESKAGETIGGMLVPGAGFKKSFNNISIYVGNGGSGTLNNIYWNVSYEMSYVVPNL